MTVLDGPSPARVTTVPVDFKQYLLAGLAMPDRSSTDCPARYPLSVVLLLITHTPVRERCCRYRKPGASDRPSALATHRVG